MKTTINRVIILAAFFFPASCKEQHTDSIAKANISNQTKTENKMVNEDVAKFLVKIADARLMGMKEGKEAEQKGTTAEIREYGSWMIIEQKELHVQIQLVAKSRNVTLPMEISRDKQEGLAELQEKSGNEFDKKFMKMMIIDHERDLKDFRKAGEYKDREVATFASKYLPVIQSHLDKIEQIQDNYKAASK